MDNQKDYDRDNEIVPFIGIQRKYVNIASKVYSILFLGYAAWIFTRKFLNSSKILEDRLEGIWAHLAGFSIVEGVVMIAIIQIGDIAMYLTSKFKMKVKKQVEAAEAKGRAEGEAKGRAEGEAKGRAESYRLWAAWNERRMEAEIKGIPFNEPPPEPPQNSNDIQD